MLLASLMFCLRADEPVVRTPSAYWFPAAEGIEKWLPRLADEELFDRWIADPKPNAKTKEAATNAKIKLISPTNVYSAANDKWRLATVELAQGKISPAAWVKRTTGLHETYHYLTTPKSPDLRSLTANIPNGLGAYSGRAVFAETLVCYWPGVPCFYSTDVYRTNYFPENKTHESWILAMNDYLGPMLSLRADHPEFITRQPTIIRADAKPGMLVFQHKIGLKTYTFYFNSGLKSLPLPKSFNSKLAIMARGLDIDTAGGPFLVGSGTMLTIDPPDS